MPVGPNQIPASVVIPAEDNTNLASDFPHPAYVGPIFHGGAIYQPMINEVSRLVQIYKSTNGSSWARMDSSNAPAFSSDPAWKRIGINPQGTKIIVTYARAADKRITVKIFDLATEAWGSAIASSVVADDQPQSGARIDEAQMDSVQLSNGDIHTFYSVDDVSLPPKTAIHKIVYNGTSWSLPEAVFTPGTTPTTDLQSYSLIAARLGSDDRIHLLADVLAYGFFHATIRGGATTFTFLSIFFDNGLLAAQSAPVFVTIGTKKYLAYGSVLADNNNTDFNFPAMVIVEDVDAPSAMHVYQAPTPKIELNGMSFLPVTVAYDSTTKAVYLLYGTFVGSQMSIKQRCWKGTVWSSESTVYSPASGTGKIIDIMAATADNGTLRLVFQNVQGGDFSVPHYYSDSISCAVAECGGGSSRSTYVFGS